MSSQKEKALSAWEQDCTEYARAMGYVGGKRVIVSDGKTVSHRGKDWFLFVADLKGGRKA